MGKFAEFILGNSYKAIFVTGFFGAMSVFFPPLSLFSCAALALVTLRKGFSPAFEVMAVSAVLIWLSWMFSPTKPGFPFPVIFFLWVPVIVGAFRLRVTGSQVKTLLAVGMVCAIYVLGLYLAVGDPLAWWSQWTHMPVPGEAQPDSTPADWDDENRLFNGFVAMGLGFGSMFALYFARWMQALLFNPGGFGAEFKTLRLDRMILVWILAGLIAAGSFQIQIMVDLFMLAMMVYVFPGIALLYAIVVRRRLSPNWMIVPFLGAYFLPVIMIPGLVILAVADSFLDFRSRL